MPWTNWKEKGRIKWSRMGKGKEDSATKVKDAEWERKQERKKKTRFSPAFPAFLWGLLRGNLFCPSVKREFIWYEELELLDDLFNSQAVLYCSPRTGERGIAIDCSRRKNKKVLLVACKFPLSCLPHACMLTGPETAWGLGQQFYY